MRILPCVGVEHVCWFMASTGPATLSFRWIIGTTFSCSTSFCSPWCVDGTMQIKMSPTRVSNPNTTCYPPLGGLAWRGKNKETFQRKAITLRSRVVWWAVVGVDGSQPGLDDSNLARLSTPALPMAIFGKPKVEAAWGFWPDCCHSWVSLYRYAMRMLIPSMLLVR